MSRVEDRISELESRIAELEATMRGLTEEYVDANERIRTLEKTTEVEKPPTRRRERTKEGRPGSDSELIIPEQRPAANSPSAEEDKAETDEDGVESSDAEEQSDIIVA